MVRTVTLLLAWPPLMLVSRLRCPPSPSLITAAVLSLGARKALVAVDVFFRIDRSVSSRLLSLICAAGMFGQLTLETLTLNGSLQRINSCFSRFL